MAAMVLASFIAGALGPVIERLMIRKLYARPLDTLLAAWGLSLIQQTFRSVFAAREVSAILPDWMMGSVQPIPSDRPKLQRSHASRPWALEHG